jgi:type IV pilus assembly protein PilV
MKSIAATPKGARRANAPRAARSRGITLIEVLIAIVLFSFGLLGLVGLQARATQYSMAAEDSNRAALLANEIVSTMWTAGTTTLDAAVVDAWNLRVGDPATGGLPNGQGTVAVVADVATVTVTWRPVGAEATVQHRYVTQAVLP